MGPNMMDERMIRISAIVGEKDRQLNAALAEICNQKAESAVRDARLLEAHQRIADLQKQNDDLHAQMADKVIDKTTKKQKGAANDKSSGH